LHRKSLLHNFIFLIIVPVIVALFAVCGCAPSGFVIDRETFQTPVKHMYLTESRYLKVWHGGTVQLISLKNIQMVTIDKSKSLVYENELYYSGEVIFKNGSKIQPTKETAKPNPLFISIHNTLRGSSKEQSFTITLDNVTQIQVKK